jgi:glycosyltransferase involved in cell wall biosynthesis
VTASTTPKRAAIYNRFWHSRGGGERHAGMIAEVLSATACCGADTGNGPVSPAPQVDLIGHGPVDLDELGEHLGLDLSRCAYRDVPDRGDPAMAEISAEYDLWITASYMSRLAPLAAHSAYLCFFPTPFDHDYAPWRRLIVRKSARWFQLGGEILGFGLGWYPPEGGRRRRWIWTSDDAVLAVPAGQARRLQMDLGRPGGPAAGLLRLETGDGQLIREIKVEQSFARTTIELGSSDRGTELHFRADTFTPGTTDRRELGVAVSRMRMKGLMHEHGLRRRPFYYLAIRYPWLRNDPHDLNFLKTYDTVLANSEYTRGFIRDSWHREADVLYPPIATKKLHPAANRDRVLLSVGRFFAPGLGHAKRQVEMVQWFGEMYRRGQLPGWRFAVVGGCEKSQLPYLAQLNEAARGLPVDIYANAPRALVEQLLSTASIFWSATGYGEAEHRPWTAEHFGMTTVEAMAGGCVPVVIDKAGQKEIITPGVDGFRWSTPADLMRQTSLVAGDEELRARLTAAAMARSATFSDEAFADRWRVIAAQRQLLD